MQDDGSWLLTDPALHTKEGGSGPTDFGCEGMHAFFHFHKCNDICKGLPKPTDMPSSPPVFLQATSQTTYSWQVVDASRCARKQTGGTCYAHASATVLRAAESRIIGRCPEDHDSLVTRIIDKYGSDGGFPIRVLNDECPCRRLSHEQVAQAGAEAAVDQGHAVLASFFLTDAGWQFFSSFFATNPSKVLDTLPPMDKSILVAQGVPFTLFLFWVPL